MGESIWALAVGAHILPLLGSGLTWRVADGGGDEHAGEVVSGELIVSRWAQHCCGKRMRPLSHSNTIVRLRLKIAPTSCLGELKFLAQVSQSSWQFLTRPTLHIGTHGLQSDRRSARKKERNSWDGFTFPRIALMRISRTGREQVG